MWNSYGKLVQVKILGWPSGLFNRFVRFHINGSSNDRRKRQTVASHRPLHSTLLKNPVKPVFLRDRSFVEKVIYNFSVRFTRALRGSMWADVSVSLIREYHFCIESQQGTEVNSRKVWTTTGQAKQTPQRWTHWSYFTAQWWRGIEVQILKNQKRDVELQLDFIKKMQESIQ